MTAPKLCAAAQRFQDKTGVHAGSVALIYGKTADRMPVAMAALKLMNMDEGARAIVAGALRQRLISGEPGHPFADLPGAVVELLPVFGIEDRGNS